MIKDGQVRKLRSLLDTGSTLSAAARRTGMNENRLTTLENALNSYFESGDLSGLQSIVTEGNPELFIAPDGGGREKLPCGF